jgi:hypothetical protein
MQQPTPSKQAATGLDRPQIRFRSGSAGNAVFEALVVVLGLSLVVALFAPAALRRQILANETVAVSALRAIVGACSAFSGTQRPHRYPASLGELAAPEEGLLDARLASGTQAGYQFSLIPETETSADGACVAEAHPVLYRRQGVHSLYLDQSGRLLAEDIGGFPGHAAMQPWDGEGP